MPDRPENIKQRLISEEAADWLLRLREGNLSDRQNYVRWLKQSPAHVREILELAFLEGLLRSADLNGLPPRDRSGTPKPAGSVVELTPRHGHEDTLPPQMRGSPWRHWRLAASACLSRIEFAGRAISKFVGMRG